MQVFKLMMSALCFAVSVFNAAAQIKSAEPKTVLDFYKLLPAKYLQIPRGVKTKTPKIAVVDIANGYLSLEPPATYSGNANWEEWTGAEIVLFKKREGGYVVGVGHTSTVTVGSTRLTFLGYGSGKWHDITKTILPKITDEFIITTFNRLKEPGEESLKANEALFVTYDLPRVGRSITARWDFDIMLFKLNWNGENFALEEIKK